MTQTQQIKTFHPKLVVFDWDGTILDTTAAIALSIQYACEKIGLPVPSTSLPNPLSVSVGGMQYESLLRPARKRIIRLLGAFTLSAIDRLRLKTIFSRVLLNCCKN